MRYLMVLTLSCSCSVPVATPPESATAVVLGPEGATCCAVAVAPDAFVTASHCVPGPRALYATHATWHANSRPLRATVIWRDGDLALLAPERQLSPRPMTTLVGKHMRAVHHGHGLVYQDQRATVLAERWLGYVVLDGVVPHGASGCGLWTDSGELAGILVRVHGGSAYAVRTERIRALTEAR